MPKGKWSSHDERRYKEILSSCVSAHRAARGRKAGATKMCKRIAAATVNRDRALADLGLGDVFERSLESGRGMSGGLLQSSLESGRQRSYGLRGGTQLLSVELNGSPLRADLESGRTRAPILSGAYDGLRGTPAEHRAMAMRKAGQAERALDRGDYSSAFVNAIAANDEAQWTDDDALKRMTFREFDFASDPEMLPRRRPLPDTDLDGLRGLRRRR